MQKNLVNDAAQIAHTGRKVWKSPAVIYSELVNLTEKLSSTAEFYVPQLNRTLGPS